MTLPAAHGAIRNRCRRGGRLHRATKRRFDLGDEVCIAGSCACSTRPAIERSSSKFTQPGSASRYGGTKTRWSWWRRVRGRGGPRGAAPRMVPKTGRMTFQPLTGCRCRSRLSPFGRSGWRALALVDDGCGRQSKSLAGPPVRVFRLRYLSDDLANQGGFNEASNP